MNVVPNTVLSSLKLLNLTERKKIVISLCSQTILNILDALSLVLLSTLTILVVQKDSEKQNSLSFKISNFVDLENSRNAVLLVLFAFISLLLRGFGTLIFAKYILRICNEISISLARKILITSEKLNPLKYSAMAEIDLTKIVAVGSKSIGSGVVAFGVLALSEAIFLIILVIPLFIVAPLVTFSIIMIFGLGIFFVQQRVSLKSEFSGYQYTQYDTSAKIKIARLGRIRKFTSISEKTQQLNDDLLEDLLESLKANSTLVYYQQVPKVAMETLLLVSGSFLVLFYAFLGNLEKGVATMVLLMAVAYRFLPAILRMQNALIFMRANFKDADKYLQFMDELKLIESSKVPTQIETYDENYLKLPEIKIHNLDFRFDEKSQQILRNFNATIKPGSFTALIGESGSGKTTLLDIIMGIRKPDAGEVIVNCAVDSDVRMSYMPQETVLLPISLLENIALGVIKNEIDIELAQEVLRVVSLEKYIPKFDLPPELSGVFQLSGGEIQRVGLARCLYLKPNLLLLDEPTSSLDALSERLLFETIENLKETATILMVTHSTQIKNYADSIYDLTQY